MQDNSSVRMSDSVKLNLSQQKRDHSEDYEIQNKSALLCKVTHSDLRKADQSLLEGKTAKPSFPLSVS